MLHRRQRRRNITNGDVTFAGVEVSRDNSGFAGGGQIGCDYQFSGGWVIGFRNMFDGTSVNRSRQFFAPAFGVTGTVNGNLNWFDALTGRLGYSFSPAGCSTVRAARLGLRPAQTSP